MAFTVGNSRIIPDRNVHMAHMGPTWVLSAPGEPHVGPLSFAIRYTLYFSQFAVYKYYLGVSQSVIELYYSTLLSVQDLQE